jgi:ubiquinone/menaquinone biosynthesis C-methylase UbiE
MKDNFSKQAGSYAQYRPGYPKELFDFILAQFDGRDAAWDCATGNGQTAKELAPFFEKVFATDISAKQLEHAVQAPHIVYSLQPAEKTNFEENSFDLVTVSQALHWLNFDEFYSEVKRVTKPGGWLAVWMYGGITISPGIDKLIRDHHDITLAECWDAERGHVNAHYSTIHFPFREIACPRFEMNYQWSRKEIEGYLLTWSALQKYIVKYGNNPVDELMNQIGKHMEKDRTLVKFPIYLRMGQVIK